ncbi:MAG: DUF72 domain-containing protein [Bryobacterales bacterium]|nr:DUF72 domain-containing protein [Bryobacterales bacterium]
MAPIIRAGVSGWNHPLWDKLVFPRPAPTSYHPLDFLSERLDAIELPDSHAIRPELAKLYAAKVARNPRFQFTARVPMSITGERDVDAARAWRQGMQPLMEAGRLGCVVMPFPESFRFTADNRDWLIQLRRALSPLPIVADLPHASWTTTEGRGTLIDYHLGFANAENAHTGYLTWKVGYLSVGGSEQGAHLYSVGELEEMRRRMERYAGFSESTFVIFRNAHRGKSVINALQMQSLVTNFESKLAAPLRVDKRKSVAASPRRAA